MLKPVVKKEISEKTTCIKICVKKITKLSIKRYVVAKP